MELLLFGDEEASLGSLWLDLIFSLSSNFKRRGLYDKKKEFVK